MVPLVFMVLSAALLGGFLVLTSWEARRGVRVLALERSKLDTRVTHLAYVATHVDFEAFLRESVRVLAARVTHDVAHVTLLLVRGAERLLTRLVRHLRTRHDIVPLTADSPRPFVRIMSDFKQQLAATRPATFPDIR